MNPETSASSPSPGASPEAAGLLERPVRLHLRPLPPVVLPLGEAVMLLHTATFALLAGLLVLGHAAGALHPPRQIALIFLCLSVPFLAQSVAQSVRNPGRRGLHLALAAVLGLLLLAQVIVLAMMPG